MKMQSAVDEYLVEIEVRKYTPKTIRSYRCNLNLFLRFCAEKLHVETVEALTPAVVRQFSRCMSEAGRKGTYINGVLKSIKSFIQYCYEEGYGGFDTRKTFKWCKEEKPVITAFSPEQVRSMLQSCRGHDYLSLRDYAILTLLFETGIRCWELCCIREEDIHNDFIIINGKNHMDSARAQYGGDLKKSTQKQLERRIQETTDTVVTREYGDYTIRDHQLAKEREDRIQEAQQSGATMAEITQIDEEYAARRLQGYRDMVDNISRKLHSDETVKKAAETIVETVETEKLNAEKDSIEGSVRDHLRGFSRTIPAFLMAYGDENTTLANFDALVPDEVFWEVTVNPQNGQGVTLDQFRMLRDGGDYVSESGEQKHFDGHLFDEVVFNDAVQEFMKKRAELANYFEPDHKGDIFDFIPPQRTNQIFTPKKVVKDMVDRLEQENPGCFDDPDATFADLYMKSGMYVTEIVTRLYQSKRMKALYPDEAERLNHIFAKQVFGCAPTEIIYRICLRYILGFSDEIHIAKNNIRLCDTLEYAKNGTMDAEVRKLFDL